LGEVRDAKLKKGMSHICGDCLTKYQALEMAHKMGKDESPYGKYGDMFGDMFGDIFKK